MTYGHLQADCLYTGISSGPNARCRVWEAFTFYVQNRYIWLPILRLAPPPDGGVPYFISSQVIYR